MKIERFHNCHAWTSENERSIIFTSYLTDICYYVFESDKIVFYDNPFVYSNTTTRQVSRWIHENFAGANAIIASAREWYKSYSGEFTIYNVGYLYRYFRYIDNQTPMDASYSHELWSIVRSAMMTAYYRYNSDRRAYASNELMLPDMAQLMAEDKRITIKSGSVGNYLYTICAEFHNRLYYIVTNYLSGTFTIEYW